jgi:ATP-dependent Lhr-like helicase
VLHAPFGGRINRAWGLALRKRFCRGFGFELQAAANEEAIVISLGPQHSFALEDVFNYLNPKRVRDLLVQALLDQPMFTTRWRWNLSRSLMLSRTEKGRRVPTALLRMRAEDRLIQAFPQVLACPETLPPGDTPVPWEHPIVRQTIEDCLEEAMDVDGLIALLEGLRSGRIRKRAVDTAEPSAFARGILNAAPYTFLDDAPLEERRTQAVATRRVLDNRSADTLGMLDPAAVARVREEAWPDPADAEELHEALLWMGYVEEREAAHAGWTAWLEELRPLGRVVPEAVADSVRWRAAENAATPADALRGRLEALGPVVVEGEVVRTPLGPEGWAVVPTLPASEQTAMLELEARGQVLRCRLEGRTAWCERRLLARIQRYTLDRLRREIEPVTAAEFWRFLAAWQHAGEGRRLVGPRGVLDVVRQLAGYEIPAARWESSVLPARVADFRPEWLDELTLTGEVAWGRLWGAGDVAVRTLPLCLVPRDELDVWTALSHVARSRPGAIADPPALGAYATAILEVLDTSGPSFAAEILRRSKLLPSHFEMGLVQLLGHGLVTCDSFGGVRRLLIAPSRRKGVTKRVPFSPPGRWSRLRGQSEIASPPGDERASPPSDETITFAARRLLDRYGVVVRDLLQRERLPFFWRDLVRVYRRLELRGDVRGGRFVQRFTGEQYALPGAIELMRKVRREGPAPEVGGLWVSAADPLNLGGILTPDARVPSQARQRVQVA